MSDPPPKQDVSKKQYLILQAKKWGFYSLSATATVFAGAVLIYVISNIVHWKSIRSHLFPGLPGVVITCFCLVIVAHTMVSGAMNWIRISRKYGKEIAPVLPLTERNALLIPPQEILVRSANVPRTEQQSALLRAAQKGPDTPTEQMLRAGQKEAE